MLTISAVISKPKVSRSEKSKPARMGASDLPRANEILAPHCEENPLHLFTSSLDGKTRRAVDFRAGDQIVEAALKSLIRAAVALNILVQAQKRAKGG